MRKIYLFALLTLVVFAFSSCDGFGGKTPEYHLSDLQGLWQEQKTNAPTEHYVRFTDEQADDEGYFFGREWDEAEDVFENNLYVYVKDTAGNDSLIHGNGWFEYQLEIKGDLHEIHFMDNGGAEIPKEYIVAVLTDTKLEYYEKDRKDRKFYFNRVVEVPETAE